MIRTWATRTSWAAIANTLNEIKATRWMRNTRATYILLCSDLGLQPLPVTQMPPHQRIHWEWVRNIYMLDYREREPELLHELMLEQAGDVLAFDWTKGAAARCGQKWMFNAMDGSGRIMKSVLTRTAHPEEVQHVIRELDGRGAKPKLIYVDAMCCCRWPAVTKDIWPDAHVRLDGFHAIRRLTETTTSTRHPWHGRFCKLLSRSIYSDDPDTLARLKAACQQNCITLTQAVRSRFVPRVVAKASQIEESIDKAIDHFKGKLHPKSGELLTAKTLRAWTNLRHHVRQGCLCDPEGVDVNTKRGSKPMRIGPRKRKICVRHTLTFSWVPRGLLGGIRQRFPKIKIASQAATELRHVGLHV